MSLLLDLDTLKNLECTSTIFFEDNVLVQMTFNKTYGWPIQRETVAHVRMTMAKPGLMPMLWPGTNEMILQI
jgi:hypothetical protein